MATNLKRTVLSITILGETDVGKTCICSVFLGVEFTDVHVATIGIDKMHSEIELETGEKIRLKWDTAGQERFRSVGVNSLKHCQGAVVVFDLTKKSTFEKVTEWIDQIKDYSDILPICLFGNKSDLVEKREVKNEEIETICKKYNIIYFETSAKNNTGIQEGLHIKNDTVLKGIKELEKEKKMKATVWVVQNSPINSQDAVNLLESISPANEFMDKVLEFFHHPDIQKIIDNNGFPIKVEIPYNIFIDFSLSFDKYREISEDDNSVINMFDPLNEAQRKTRKEIQDIKTNYKFRHGYTNIR